MILCYHMALQKPNDSKVFKQFVIKWHLTSSFILKFNENDFLSREKSLEFWILNLLFELKNDGILSKICNQFNFEKILARKKVSFFLVDCMEFLNLKYRKYLCTWANCICIQAEWILNGIFAFSQIINRPNLFKFRHYQIVLQNILHSLSWIVYTVSTGV